MTKHFGFLWRFATSQAIEDTPFGEVIVLA